MWSAWEEGGPNGRISQPPAGRRMWQSPVCAGGRRPVGAIRGNQLSGCSDFAKAWRGARLAETQQLAENWIAPPSFTEASALPFKEQTDGANDVGDRGFR